MKYSGFDVEAAQKLKSASQSLYIEWQLDF